MGIQDKIFDVETELENLNACEQTKQDFHDIITYLGDLERSLEDYGKHLITLMLFKDAKELYK